MKRSLSLINYYLNIAASAPSSRDLWRALEDCANSFNLFKESNSLPSLNPKCRELIGMADSAKKRRLWSACRATSLRLDDSNPSIKTRIVALPFVITFKESSLGVLNSNQIITPQVIENMAQVLIDNNEVNPNGLLSIGRNLLNRESIESLDFEALKDYQREPSASKLDAISSSSAHVVSDIPAYRTRTLYLLASCQLPAEELAFLSTSPESRPYELEQIMENALRDAGVEITDILGAPPTDLEELFPQFSGVSRWELEANVLNAIDLYGEDISIRARVYEKVGFVEVLGRDQEGTSFSITPLFSSFESLKELSDCLSDICANYELSFNGISALSSRLSSNFH